MLRRLLPPASLILLGLAAPASAQVKLELKHPENSSATYKTTTKVQQTMTINAMDIETKSQEVVTYSVSVGRRRSDGALPVSRKIESVKANLELPGGITLSFDSENPEATKDPQVPQLAMLPKLFQAIAGSSYTILIDKSGKVTGVEGTEEALKKVEGEDPQVIEAIKQRFDPELLKQSFEQEHRLFPDQLLREGDTWERTEVTPLGGGQSLTFKRKYEYKSTVQEDGKTLDKITGQIQSVTYDSDPKANNPVKVDKSDLKTASSETIILFDREAGRIVHRTGSVRITGELTLNLNGQELPAQLDLTLDSKIELQKASK
ncbi:MAG: hypothetical protein IRY99_19965 [Isosphaeraceae bacterium]|nr:hypothetical protein [Isosphaeraceae bacterium]